MTQGVVTSGFTTPAVKPTGRSNEGGSELGSVSLVIPARNAAKTIGKCLDSVLPLVESHELGEVILVDDGSTDETAEIAGAYPVRVLTGQGLGPGAARNQGWNEAVGSFIWFVDSDCVCHPDALTKLLPHFDSPRIAGVGGSYANLFPDSLVASLIHEEIVARHRRMERDVNFLATFNVVYRRRVLEETGGFDESLKLAQDAELAYRVRSHGYGLRFDESSRVGHHHPTKMHGYLRTQARQGFYRIALYRRHPSKVSGDSYAGLTDYLQPPTAMLMLATLPFICFPGKSFLPLAFVVALVAMQFPMTTRLVRHAGASMVAYVPFGFVRAVARGIGMTLGVLSVCKGSVKQRSLTIDG